MFRFKIIGIILCLFSLRAHSSGEEQLSQLFSYFQSSCPTQGEWTKTALNHTKALISVLKSIQNDPDCRTMSGAISQLDFLALKLQDLRANSTEREVISLRKQQQALLLQMSSDPNSSLLPIIESSLQQNQIQLAQYLGYQDAERSAYHTNQSQMLRNLVVSSNVLMTQAVANQTCLLKNPSLLSGIGSVAGAVSAGVLTSGVSLGVSAAVDLFGSVVNQVIQMRTARRIRPLIANMGAPVYDCVLEALSNQWCGAQDALNVIGAKSAALTGTQSEDEIWTGLKILDRDLPVILDWLSHVEAGADPTNQAQGSRQNKVLVRRQMIQSARPLGLGTLNEKKVLFDQAKLDTQKWIVIRSAIPELLASVGISSSSFVIVTAGGSPAASSPLLDIYSSDYAPYYLLGLSLAEAPRQNGAIVPFASFDPFTTANPAIPGWPIGLPAYKPDLGIVRSQFLAWVQAAQDQVTNEFAAILQPDPLSVISDGATQIAQRGPRKFLQRVSSFLSQELVRGAGVNQKIYTDTVTRLNNMIFEMDRILKAPAGAALTNSVCDEPNTPAPTSSEEAASRALACIYKQARLEYGTVFIRGRLERSIRIKLNDVLLSGKIRDPGLAAKLLASDDILRDLSAYSGNSNLYEMSRDAETSQRITNKNLAEFTSLFGGSIASGLRQSIDLEKQLGSAGKNYGRSRAETCLMLLAVPQWPREIPREFCIGSQLPSFFVGGPAAPMITLETLVKPQNERACAFRDYRRGSMIYQNYRTESESFPRQ